MAPDRAVPLRIYVRRAGIGHGDGYGFITAQRIIHEALTLSGAVITRDAPAELIHVAPHMYRKDPTRFSILWPTAETHDIPGVQVRAMNTADTIIASCQHNKEVFERCGVTKPVHVCNLALDTDVWAPEPRPALQTRCRFYWEGQRSLRKGWDIVGKAFEMAFTKQDNVELYMKTTGGESQEQIRIEEHVYLDSRNLSLADLLDLYTRSSAMVFPTRGEGTGLPALQAMAKGIFLIAPSIMGLKDFVSEDTALVLPTRRVNVDFGMKTQAEDVAPEDLATAMRRVYDNDGSLDPLVRNARHLVEQRFTLEALGRRLTRILQEVVP